MNVEGYRMNGLSGKWVWMFMIDMEGYGMNRFSG